MKHELEVALRAVRRAARLTRRVQPSPDVALDKDDRSPVTVADFGAQALVCATLAEAFPQDPVIGEESGDPLREASNVGLLAQVTSEVRREVPEVDAGQVLRWIDRGGQREPAPRAWTLDPIDGTKGFLRGQHYAVAVALLEGSQVRVAALACPRLPCGEHLGTLAWAIRGEGAFMVPLDQPEAEPVRLAVAERPLPEARQLESVEPGHHDRELADRLRGALGIEAEPVRLDSMTKYLVLARGEADLYLRFTREGYKQKIWDHAAGSLLVEEAGGRVSDLAGGELDFGLGALLDAPGGLIASHGGWHDEVLAALK